MNECGAVQCLWVLWSCIHIFGSVRHLLKMPSPLTLRTASRTKRRPRREQRKSPRQLQSKETLPMSNRDREEQGSLSRDTGLTLEVQGMHRTKKTRHSLGVSVSYGRTVAICRERELFVSASVVPFWPSDPVPFTGEIGDFMVEFLTPRLQHFITKRFNDALVNYTR